MFSPRDGSHLRTGVQCYNCENILVAITRTVSWSRWTEFGPGPENLAPVHRGQAGALRAGKRIDGEFITTGEVWGHISPCVSARFPRSAPQRRGCGGSLFPGGPEPVMGAAPAETAGHPGPDEAARRRIYALHLNQSSR